MVRFIKFACIAAVFVFGGKFNTYMSTLYDFGLAYLLIRNCVVNGTPAFLRRPTTFIGLSSLNALSSGYPSPIKACVEHERASGGGCDAPAITCGMEQAPSCVSTYVHQDKAGRALQGKTDTEQSKNGLHVYSSQITVYRYHSRREEPKIEQHALPRECLHQSRQRQQQRVA